MPRYHDPLRHAVLLTMLWVTGSAATAKPREPIAPPSAPKTFIEVKSHNGSFDIVSSPVSDGPPCTVSTVHLGTSVQLDRALIATPRDQARSALQ